MKKKLWIPTALAAVVLLTSPFTVGLFTMDSNINCKRQYINIKTGQARHTLHLWFIPLRDRIEDTALSLALGGELVDANSSIAPWQRVNTFPLFPGGGVSPHYNFHGALAEVRTFQWTCDYFKFDPERRREIAMKILSLWQTGGSDSAARQYLNELTNREDENRRKANPEGR